MNRNETARDANASRTQADHDGAHTDDPRQAIESGEPQIAGHTQGHVAHDRQDDVEGANRSGVDANKGETDDGEDWESGRQHAL
jgi:hypothetical protein